MFENSSWFALTHCWCDYLTDSLPLRLGTLSFTRPGIPGSQLTLVERIHVKLGDLSPAITRQANRRQLWLCLHGKAFYEEGPPFADSLRTARCPKGPRIQTRTRPVASRGLALHRRGRWRRGRAGADGLAAEENSGLGQQHAARLHLRSTPLRSSGAFAGPWTEASA